MIAQVIINSNAKDLNKLFDYEIPDEMKDTIKIGNRILIPFGRMKKLEEGFVIGFKESSEFKTKKIEKIQEDNFLDENKIKLAKWIARRYFCNIADAIKLMLPPGTTTKNIENRVQEKTANFVYLKKDDEDLEEDIESGKIKSEKHKRVLNFLIQNEGILIQDLELYTDVSRAILKTLEKNGYIEIIEKEIQRNPFKHKVVEKNKKLKFTKEQQIVYTKIEEAIDDKMNSEFLIHGVTGSRKNRNIFTSNRKSITRRKTKYNACTGDITYSSNGR